MSNYTLGLITQALLFASIATGFNLLIGFGRLFSVAQAAFVGVGAYAVAIGGQRYDASFEVSLGIGILVATGLGLLVGLLALRVSDDYLAIATFAVQIVFTSALTNFRDFSGGAYGIPGVSRASIGNFEASDPAVYPVIAGVTLVVCLEVCRRIRSSPFGLVLRAAGEDEVAARALGKRTRQSKVVIVGLSAGLAALAGGIYASYLGYILPASFDIHFSILLLSMVIIGGSGSVIGPAIGATLMVAIPDLLNNIGVTNSTVVYVRQLVFGIALLLVVVLLKRGLVRPRYGFRGKRFAIEGNEDGEAPPLEVRGDLLEASGLSKSFGGIQAVTDVDLVLRPGEITGLVGPNGAGKTTLFDLMTGAIRPTAGSTSLGGTVIDELRMEDRSRLGLLRSFQGLRLFPGLSALENVLVAVPLQRDERMSTAVLRRGRVKRALRTAHTEAARSLRAVGLESGWDRPASELSYAEQKLLSLARVLAARPSVVLLDEPASGLDHATLDRMAELVRSLAERGHTVCVVEHNTAVLREVADRMVFLHVGRVEAIGTPDEIIADPRLAAIYFGVPDEQAVEIVAGPG